MRYAVDPYLVVDVLDGDPEWGERSARLFDAHQGDTLVMSSLAYLSLAPAFGAKASIFSSGRVSKSVGVTKMPLRTNEG